MFSEADIAAALQVLRRGGIILYPTDTIWGIGCDATNAEAIARIFTLKQRPDHKSMIVLMASERELYRYVAAPEPELFDFLDACKQPTTVIYEGAIGFPEQLTGADGSIGIRIVKDEFCRHLIKRLGRPLVSTSANLSGQKTAELFSAIQPEIRMGVDYVVNYRQTEQQPARPSTIVKWTAGGGITILRP